MDFRNRKVTVMGLGHFGGGVGAARWFARRGAFVTVTDLADEKTLADSLMQLEGFPLAAVHLGGHREEDFRKAELVVVNPAVRPGNPFLKTARDAGVPILSELEIFLERLSGEDHRRDRLERQIDDRRDDCRDSP